MPFGVVAHAPGNGLRFVLEHEAVDVLWFEKAHFSRSFHAEHPEIVYEHRVGKVVEEEQSPPRQLIVVDLDVVVEELKGDIRVIVPNFVSL